MKVSENALQISDPDLEEEYLFWLIILYKNLRLYFFYFHRIDIHNKRKEYLYHKFRLSVFKMNLQHSKPQVSFLPIPDKYTIKKKENYRPKSKILDEYRCKNSQQNTSKLIHIVSYCSCMIFLSLHLYNGYFELFIT